MSWSYSAGILTSTGGTEGSPDLLTAGVDVVEAADNTKGYRDGYVAWLTDVQVRANGSWIRIDDDLQLELRGGSYIYPNTGGVTHGARSTLIINTTTARVDGALNFATGSSLVSIRTRPNDPNPKIVYRNTARHDYPSVGSTGSIPAKVNIAGLDIYSANNVNSFLKFYFGSTSGAVVSNVRVFFANSLGSSVQFFGTTFTNYYSESLILESESSTNTVILNTPTYYRASPTTITGAFRNADLLMRNPTFLNNCWDGSINFSQVINPNKFSIVYTFKNTFKIGLTAIQGVVARYTRSLQSSQGTVDWTTPSNASINVTSNSSGTFTDIDLLDAYHEKINATSIERYNWTGIARAYSRRTPGNTLFSNRVLFAHSVNMSAGYAEEVQMSDISYLTLTETQAGALAGISFSASGTTSGTVTITSSTSFSNLWHYYRWWISRLANFDSVDSWSFSPGSINCGAWNIVFSGVGVGGSGDTLIQTSGTITLQSGATQGNVTLVDSSGTRLPNALLTFTGIPSGTEARIRQGSRTIIHEENITDGDFVFSHQLAGEKITFAFNNPGYSQISADLTLLSSNQTIPLTFEPDPSYI